MLSNINAVNLSPVLSRQAYSVCAKKTDSDEKLPSEKVEISSIPPLENPDSHIKTIVSGLGYAEFPQMSPDGEKLLFNVVNDFKTSQIFITDKEGVSVRSLFTEDKITPKNIDAFFDKFREQTDEQATWSQDGKSIFYRSNKTGLFSIEKFDYDKKDRKELFSDPSKNLKHPVETSDGCIICYGGPPGNEIITSEAYSDIFKGDPRTGKLESITHSDGSYAYKHPSEIDGMIIAHKEPRKSSSENADIVLINPATGNEKNITNTSDFSEKHPFYNEKKGILAFHSDETGDKNIWLSTPDGSRRCQLTFYNKPAQSPCWSLDGKQIYFIKKKKKQPEGEPFYKRQADVNRINVKAALKDLKAQAELRINKLELSDATESQITKAKEEYDNYGYFLEKYKK